MSDLAIAARRLALEHVRPDAERETEAQMRAGRHGSSNDRGDVSIGGYVDGKWRNDRVVVRRIGPYRGGIACTFDFSLHELYEECRKGQTALL